MTDAIYIVGTFLASVLAGVAIFIAMRPLRLARQAEKLARAQRDFHRQREQLEAKFFDHVSSSG